MSEYTEIQDGVYDITSIEHDDGRRYRVFLVDGDVPTLFDTAWADDVDSTIAGIDATGVTPERLIITHNDPDHADAIAELEAEYDLEVCLSAQTDIEGREADRVFDDGDTLSGFVAVNCPGHNDDSYAFIDEDRGIMVSGDVVSGSDQRGMPSGYPILPPAVYSTDLNELEENLAKLVDYDFDKILLYHGSSILENGQERLERFVNFPGKPD